MVTVEFKEDYRAFKVGDKFTFEDNTLIIGSNGTGKSSLLNILRSTWEGHYMGRVTNHKDIATVTVDKSFTNFYDYCTESDSAIGKSFSDMSYLLNQGLGLLRASSGQVQMEQLTKVFIKIAQGKPVRGLLVLDEPEVSLDLKNLQRVSSVLFQLNIKYGIKVIVSTHNESIIRGLFGFYNIYDLDTRTYLNKGQVKDLLKPANHT